MYGFIQHFTVLLGSIYPMDWSTSIQLNDIDGERG
jgi:hypothetical protein